MKAFLQRISAGENPTPVSEKVKLSDESILDCLPEITTPSRALIAIYTGKSSWKREITEDYANFVWHFVQIFCANAEELKKSSDRIQTAKHFENILDHPENAKTTSKFIDENFDVISAFRKDLLEGGLEQGHPQHQFTLIKTSL